MIRRSRPPQSERRHRGPRRSTWAWLAAPGHRAAVVALGGTLAIVGLMVVVGVVGGTGRFTPLPRPQAGDSGAGGTPTTGWRTSPADPRESSASRTPTRVSGPATSSTSPRAAASPGTVGQPTPSSPPSTLDTSVEHPAHHGKPPWSGAGTHDVKPDVSP